MWSITENKFSVNKLLLPFPFLVVYCSYGKSVDFSFCTQLLHQMFLLILAGFAFTWFCFISFCDCCTVYTLFSFLFVFSYSNFISLDVLYTCPKRFSPKWNRFFHTDLSAWASLSQTLFKGDEETSTPATSFQWGHLNVPHVTLCSSRGFSKYNVIMCPY